MKETPPMVYTVSEFQTLVREYLTGVGTVEVRGEVAEFKIAQGKYVYFYLKDAAAQVQCFLMTHELPFPLEDGFEVTVKGSPTIFQKRGDFVFRVAEISVTGEGNLRKALELLKRKLEQEGLFRIERKRPIPLYPRRIGLVTSRDSAAITDFYRGLRDRWGGVEIYLVHVAVQGKEAVPQIVRAFTRLNASNLSLDLVVLIRGGGGLEDLMPFNSEPVTRAVFGSAYPVVVGVGHERDVTLASLAADIRASTPTKAAEIVFPHRDEVSRSLVILENDLLDGFSELVDRRWETLTRSLATLVNYFDRKKHRSLELIAALQHHLKTFEYRATIVTESMRRFSLFIRQTEIRAAVTRTALTGTYRLLTKLSPLETLKRGYAIVTDRRGRVMSDIERARPDTDVVVHMASGALEARVSRVVKSVRRLKRLLHIAP